jgi:hypothetical protein
MPLFRADSRIRTTDTANRDGLPDRFEGVQELVIIQLFLKEMLARCSLRAGCVNCRRSLQVYAREFDGIRTQQVHSQPSLSSVGP